VASGSLSGIIHCYTTVFQQLASFVINHEFSFYLLLRRHVKKVRNAFLMQFTYGSLIPVLLRNSNTIYKPWLTKGIKISCNQKRELYLTVRESNEIECKLHYKHYCKMLSKVIKEAKK
jgi:hypothetical protein